MGGGLPADFRSRARAPSRGPGPPAAAAGPASLVKVTKAAAGLQAKAGA